MNKKELRKKILKVLDNMDDDLKIKKSNEAFNELINDKNVIKSENIMCFVSFKNEIDTHKLIKYFINKGKNVYIPFVDTEKNIMLISKLESFDELEKGYYGILEPKEEFLRITSPNILDTVITPGVVFDKRGYRIGYGGGFYDKFYAMENMNVKKIGFCYREQIVDRVPIEKFDVKLDYIISK